MNKIEIKSLKVYESMSEETNCFNCFIYIDGKKAIYVKNQGQGGDNDYDVSFKYLEQVNKFIYNSFPNIKKEIDKEDYLQEDFSLELFIDKAINEYFNKKLLKSFERRRKNEFIIVHDLLDSGEYTYWSLKKLSYDKIKDYVLRNNTKYPNPIIINELSLQEGYKLTHEN
tara:strand:- start:45 stop:554 length:510 start_codon:yes stop_codon:yes gene_type:complete